jgi:FixJ family two-component response regulator
MTLNSSQPTVFVVDDDPDLLHDSKLLFDSVGMKCETFATADEFLDGYSPKPSSCLVLDIRLPGMSGLELQEQLAEKQVDIPIIMITGHADVQMAVTAMRRGAFDFIQKPFRDQVLLNSINEAISAISRSQDLNEQNSDLAEKWASLTPREKEVAELVVSGKPNKVSAYELGVSQRTVEIHRARVMRKTGAQSLADLVRMSLLVDT